MSTSFLLAQLNGMLSYFRVEGYLVLFYSRVHMAQMGCPYVGHDFGVVAGDPSHRRRLLLVRLHSCDLRLLRVPAWFLVLRTQCS